MQTGLRIPGNIDLNARPIVRNPDGSISTVRSMSIGTDQGEVLIPTVVGNRVVSDEAAIQHYRQTGEQLGIFDTPENATAYAQSLHRQQEQQYMPQVQQTPAKTVPDELAARGLRTYSNHLRYAPPSVQNAGGGDPMSAALQGGADDAQAAMSGGNPKGGGAVGSAVVPPPATVDPALAQQFEQAAAQSPQDGGDSIILPLLAVGALGATALTAYRVWKSSRPAPTAPIDGAGGAPSGGTALAPNTGGPAGNPQQALLDAGDGSVYGEFKEVNEPRLPPPSTQNRPKPATVAEALTATPGAQRRLSREQASAVQQRSAQVQPNDMSTMAGHDEFPYTEEQVRHANALADELIAQRLRGQRLRSRGTTGRAGEPSAPINPRRPSAGVSEARPSLVNEILGIMRRGIVR